MDVQIRRQRSAMVADQENQMVRPGKAAGLGGLKARAPGLAPRGVLGDLSNNLPPPASDVGGKIAAAAAEFEKKATISRPTLRSAASYKHVQSKVNTGLPRVGGAAAGGAAVPSARPPLRREESTAAHAVRALARAKVTATIKEKCRSKENVGAEITVNSKEDARCERRPLEAQRPPRQQLLLPRASTRRSKEKAEVGGGGGGGGAPGAADATLEPRTPQLPPDVEDVDARDDNSPLLMSIYIKDIYKYLTEMELKYRIEPDHLKKQTAVTGRMRATLVDWLVEVHRQFSLLQETFQMTVGIIDRYLQAKHDVERNRLQLVGVTAMFIACKYEEIYAPEVHDLVYVTDNAYSKADVLACERDIMRTLQFCLGRPLPLHFSRRFVKVADGNSKNHHLAKYFVDLCLVEYTTAHYRPSELAAAAMCLSIYLLSTGSRRMEELWTPTLAYYSGYRLAHLRPLMRAMARLARQQDSSAKLQAVRNKYREAALARVADLPALRSHRLDELAASPPASPAATDSPTGTDSPDTTITADSTVSPAY